MSVEPFLFSADATLVAATCDPDRKPDERAGAVVVDWERRGKADRQANAEGRIGTDTQINADTPDDLARIRAAIDVPVICRINGPGPDVAREVDLAVSLGADEILVPMVRRVADVEQVLDRTGDQAGVAVMVETADAVERAADLARLPIRRVYVGLMDLALDRRTPSIFTALVDGTLERVREQMPVPFGFGGLTVPGGGTPIPTDLLLGEMARLDCSFTFLRRSFIADVAGRDAAAGIGAIRVAASVAADRSPAVVAEDRRRLVDAITGLGATPPGAPA